jgi:hypothetical protein
VGVPAALVLLYVLPPDMSFLPPCWLHWLTGLHCPGCGATRSTRALLHGDLCQALAYNPLFVLMLPFLAYVGIPWLYGLWLGQSSSRGRVPAWTTSVLLGVLIAFAILRNVDVYPFSLLAPHDLP